MKLPPSRIAFAAALVLMGCSSPSTSGDSYPFPPEEVLPLAPRPITIVAEACTLDAWQSSTLLEAHVHQLSVELILVCPQMRANADVAPVDPDARAALGQQIAAARALGYRVKLGVTMGDDLQSFPVPYTGARTDAAFGDPKWRDAVIANLAPFAQMSDGLEIDLVSVPNDLRANLSLFFGELDTQLHAGKTLGAMAPPSAKEPTDTPGGDAFDLAAIGAHVDRIRLMTQDLSCCGQGPGPDTDVGWALTVAELARTKTNKPLDVSFPLYGTDQTDLGDRYVTYDDARAMADTLRIAPDRDPGGELHFDWTDLAAHAHHTWFPDGTFAARTLHAFDAQGLPADVGVVLYGLGAEDPKLWDTLARGRR